ncbi:hypothetical protein ElyMa_002858800 [Elysia marginata]|uniref:Secreted protein n=1 Tax=Elysia marginata TaxID=1093978 RepID=A0AAV4HZR0_9GAST|nr:hypothetical protein ElyMa_002858800 [Elysia marginata]
MVAQSAFRVFEKMSNSSISILLSLVTYSSHHACLQPHTRSLARWATGSPTSEVCPDEHARRILEDQRVFFIPQGQASVWRLKVEGRAGNAGKQQRRKETGRE